jgi:hypothetical protein
MRHPDIEGFPLGKAVKDPFGSLDDDARMPIFSRARALDFPPEEMREELKPVADAQDGHAQLEETPVHSRGPVEIDAGGPPRQDDSPRRKGAKLIEGDAARVYFAIDTLFSDAASNELRVLRAEVDDENEFASGHGGTRSRWWVES